MRSHVSGAQLAINFAMIIEDEAVLPTESPTPELEAANAELDGADEAYMRNAPRLTDAQLLDIAKYIQAYNYIELNLRRAIDAFAASGVLPERYNSKYRKLRTPELIAVVAETVASRRLPEAEEEELLKLLKDIEEGRKQRNIFAHWAPRQHPTRPMIIFMSKDENDAMRVRGVYLEPGRVATATIYAEDLPKFASKAVQMDYFFALEVGKWVDSMPRES